MWLALRTNQTPTAWADEGERIIATAVDMLQRWDDEARGGDRDDE